MMRISPFLEKKFFEYLDERIAKGTTVVSYEINLKSKDKLIELSEIIESKYECLFYISNESERRKVFLMSGRSYSSFLLTLFEECDGAAFHAENGGISISVDKDEDCCEKYLRMTASGSCVDIMNDFAERNGGVFY